MITLFLYNMVFIYLFNILNTSQMLAWGCYYETDLEYKNTFMHVTILYPF